MSLNRIHSELEYILHLVRRWQREGGASLIEKEIALHKMRTLYELTSSLDTTAAVAAEPEEELSAEPEVEVEVELLFDEPAEAGDEEQSAKNGTCGAQSDIVADCAPETGPAAASAAETENGIESPTAAAPAPQPEPAPAPAPKQTKEDSPRQVIENELFDVEKEAPRRSRRNALLSLYGDNSRPCKPAPQQPAPPAVPEPEPVAEAPAPAPQPSAAGEPAATHGIPAALRTEEPQVQSADTCAEAAEAAPQALSAPESEPEKTDPEPAEYPALELITEQISAAEPEEAASTEQNRPDTELPAFEPDTVFDRPEAESDTPTAVLGEVINTDTRTLADTLAAAAPQSIMAAERLTSLRDGLGLNDKFLIIRDLFDDDGALYEQAIDELDGFDDLDDAMLYIYDKHWNQNSDGVKLLVELLIRKLA